MGDLISRKALLEAHQDLVAFGTDTTFAVRNLITNAPAIEQGEPVAYMNPNAKDTLSMLHWVRNEYYSQPLYTAPPQPQSVKDALEKAARIVQAKIGHYYPTPLTDAVTEIRALIED